MQRIVLIYPPHWDTPMPPLGIAYISAFLKSRRYEVYQKDLNHTFRYKYHLTNNELSKEIEKIVALHPDVVGISIGHTTFKYSIKLMELLKKQMEDVFTIAGGPHISYIGERIIGDFPELFDIGVFSEGEETVLDILKKKSEGSNLEDIPGTFVRKRNGLVIRNTIREKKYTFDDLPFPNFDDFHLDTYPLPMLPILTSRGCIRNCSFCGFKGNQVSGEYQERSIDNVVEEIHRNLREYRIKTYLFGDALLNSNPKRLDILCDAIIKEKLDIYWFAEVFPNLKKTLCEKMYKAGCRFLWISPETGCPTTAKHMKKGVDIDIAKTSIKNAKNSRIFTSVWFILGFPTEDYNDLEMTINYVRKQKKYIDECSFVPFHLMVGSPIYETPGEYNIEKIDDNRYEMFSSFRKKQKKISKFKIIKYSEKLWDEFNSDSRFNFEIEKRIFFERLGLVKRPLFRLITPDYFDKKKTEYRYEDSFKKALSKDINFD